jgi:hypothetical protein
MPGDVRTYVERDWLSIAESKDAAWLEHRRRQGVTGAWHLAEELRTHVLAHRNRWPTEEERDDDLATHFRGGELMRRVRRIGTN